MWASVVTAAVGAPLAVLPALNRHVARPLPSHRPSMQFYLSLPPLLPGLMLLLSGPSGLCLQLLPPAVCRPHGGYPISALCLASMSSFGATVNLHWLRVPAGGWLGVQRSGAAMLAPVLAIVLPCPCGSSSRWGGHGSGQGLTPPSPHSVLISPNPLNYGCACALRGEGCCCRRHPHCHIDWRIAHPISCCSCVQVAPPAYSCLSYHTGEAYLFVSGSPHRCLLDGRQITQSHFLP